MPSGTAPTTKEPAYVLDWWDDIKKRGLHYEEPSPELDALARKVIGAAIEVHRVLGPGFLESVYEEALCVEFELRGIPFERQREVEVLYKGRQVGRGCIDLLVGNALVVELKVVDKLGPVHSAQVISYLRASKCKLGLLLNLKADVMKDGIARVVLS